MSNITVFIKYTLTLVDWLILFIHVSLHDQLEIIEFNVECIYFVKVVQFTLIVRHHSLHGWVVFSFILYLIDSKKKDKNVCRVSEFFMHSLKNELTDLITQSIVRNKQILMSKLTTNILVNLCFYELKYRSKHYAFKITAMGQNISTYFLRTSRTICSDDYYAD